MAVGIKFQATPEERRLIETVASVGLSHEQMCYLIERPDGAGVKKPISADTLVKHFGDELAQGKSRTIAKVAGKLVQTALGPPSPQATTSQIFFLKTQAGWRETAGLEVFMPDGEEGDAVDLAARVAGLIERGRRRKQKADAEPK